MDAKQDAQAFTEVLESVAEFYDRTVSPSLSTFFFGALRAYDFPIVHAAFEHYMRSGSSKFGFPKPAHIIEIIEGTDEERDAHVWAILNTAVRRIGPYFSVIIEDPALAQAITRKWGSWASCVEFFGASSDVLWQQQRKDFVSLYRIGQKTGAGDREPIMLSGRCAIESAGAKWFPSRQPFGVILLDGTIETRYFPLDGATGLPVGDIRAQLAIPAAPARPQLTAGETETDDEPVTPDPEKARRMLREIFDEWNRIQQQRFAEKPTIADAEAAREADRKAFLRRQYEEDLRSAKTVRSQEKRGGKGRADRTSVHGRKTAKTGT